MIKKYYICHKCMRLSEYVYELQDIIYEFKKDVNGDYNKAYERKKFIDAETISEYLECEHELDIEPYYATIDNDNKIIKTDLSKKLFNKEKFIEENKHKINNIEDYEVFFEVELD